jgi:hypothetical protein
VKPNGKEFTEPMETTTPITSDAEKATIQYLRALEMKETVEKALETAKSLLLESYASAGIEECVAEGKRVVAVEAVRRNFDAKALRPLVSDDTFTLVTKVTVESKAFDKAMEKGLISPEVEQAVVKPTFYTAIRISDNAVSSAEELTV